MLSLKDSVEKLHLMKPDALAALSRLDIRNVIELLYHFPRDWQDLSEIKTISQAAPNEKANLRATLKSLAENRSRWRRVHVINALFEDKTGSIAAVWFNQPYIRHNLKIGREYYLSGKVYPAPLRKTPQQPLGLQSQSILAEKPNNPPQRGGVYSKDTLQLQNPTFEFVKPDTIHTAGIIPIYDLTEGVTQKQLRYWLSQIMPLTAKIPDLLPDKIKKALELPDLAIALQKIHFPDKPEEIKKAYERLAFEELFLFQLALLSFKSKLKTLSAPRIPLNTETIKKFVASLTFELTHSQRLAIWEILKDLTKSYPMNRLLEGEVGSGKTVVAGLAMLEAANNNYQSVMLAPTEILAWQHYSTLQKLFGDTEVEVALLTRSHKIGELSDIASGKIKIIVGTHALLQEGVKFKKIGLLVIDEQHRFGVKQRQALLRNPNDTNTSELPESEKSKIIEKKMSYQLNNIFWKIQNELGRFARERQYADALEVKLKESNISFKRESAIVVAGRKSNFADFIVADRILIEGKAKPYIQKEDYYQTLRYLKSANLELGLIVNFRQEYLKPKRILNPDFSGNSGESSGHSGRLIPHLLSMTATPIPRTLALAFYGDLDISELRELPSGRKKIITRLVSPDKREIAYEFIRKKIAQGRQMYVVTPLIESSPPAPLPEGEGGPPRRTGEGVKAATAEIEKLKKIFPEFHIGLLHGRLPGEEKKQTMDKYKNRELDILVSTSVIEVGVDVANATVMIIENAERFGLSQLHQLRGRVGRGEHQSYCLLFADTLNEYTKERLLAVVNSNDGFELAEKDLELRGSGEIMGARQSGFIPFKIAKLSDKKLIKLAKKEAENLLKTDQNLDSHPLLKQKTAQIAKDAHLE